MNEVSLCGVVKSRCLTKAIKDQCSDILPCWRPSSVYAILGFLIFLLFKVPTCFCKKHHILQLVFCNICTSLGFLGRLSKLCHCLFYCRLFSRTEQYRPVQIVTHTGVETVRSLTISQASITDVEFHDEPLSKYVAGSFFVSFICEVTVKRLFELFKKRFVLELKFGEAFYLSLELSRQNKMSLMIRG